MVNLGRMVLLVRTVHLEFLAKLEILDRTEFRDRQEDLDHQVKTQKGRLVLPAGKARKDPQVVKVIREIWVKTVGEEKEVNKEFKDLLEDLEHQEQMDCQADPAGWVVLDMMQHIVIVRHDR